MNLEQHINQQIKNKLNPKLIIRLEMIKNKAKERLRYEVWQNVYERYSPIVYERTYQLIDSITASPIVIKANGEISFELYFDSNKMHHYSVVSGNEYWKGKKINVAFLIDEGHYRPGIPWFDDYPATNFIRDAIKEIRDELEREIKDAIKIEVKRLNNKKTW